MKINCSILKLTFISQNKFIIYNDNTSIIWSIYAKEKKISISNITAHYSKSLIFENFFIFILIYLNEFNLFTI